MRYYNTPKLKTFKTIKVNSDPKAQTAEVK